MEGLTAPFRSVGVTGNQHIVSRGVGMQVTRIVIHLPTDVLEP